MHDERQGGIGMPRFIALIFILVGCSSQPPCSYKLADTNPEVICKRRITQGESIAYYDCKGGSIYFVSMRAEKVPNGCEERNEFLSYAGGIIEEVVGL